MLNAMELITLSLPGSRVVTEPGTLTWEKWRFGRICNHLWTKVTLDKQCWYVNMSASLWRALNGFTDPSLLRDEVENSANSFNLQENKCILPLLNRLLWMTKLNVLCEPDRKSVAIFRRFDWRVMSQYPIFVFSVFKMRMSKFFFQLVIVIHVFACAWYFLACPLNECSREHNWVEHQGK